MTNDKRAATPEEAEEHAKRAVRDYLNACNMQSRDDLGNALMKLVSVAGLLMACNEGREIAAQRLECTAAFVWKNGHKFPHKPETAQ